MKILPEITSIVHLFHWMGKYVKYKYLNDKGKPSIAFDKMYPNYRLQTPKQVAENKFGICWDQTHFEQAWMNERDIENYVFYIELDIPPKMPTHTFLIYRYDDYWYYFENSFVKLRRNQKISNISSLIKMIINEVYEDAKKEDPDLEYDLSKTFLSKVEGVPPFGCDVVEYMEFCHGYENIYKQVTKGLL